MVSHPRPGAPLSPTRAVRAQTVLRLLVKQQRESRAFGVLDIQSIFGKSWTRHEIDLVLNDLARRGCIRLVPGCSARIGIEVLRDSWGAE